MTTNPSPLNQMPRWALLAMASLSLLAAPVLVGCSSSFWDRSPAQARVQGIFVRGPLWDVNDPSQLNGPQLNGPAAPAVAADWNRNPVLTGDPDGESTSSARAVPEPTEHDFAALTEVNRARAQHGLSPVRYQAQLFAAAHAHSFEQMRDSFLGHDSRDPARATLGQRMQLEGYIGRTYAEVVAKDFPDARSVVAAWLDSPRHREVLLDPDLSEAAFSRVDGPSNRTNRWTGDFGDPGRSFTPIPAAAKPEPIASLPPVPSPATRVSLPPAPPRSNPGALSQPTRPPVPSPIRSSEPQPSGFPPSAPAPSAAPTNVQPRVVTQAPPARTDGVAPGNVVPPAPGRTAYNPARPYVPPAVAPRTSTPVPTTTAVAPRPTYVTPVPTPAPVQRPYYRPNPVPRRVKDCKT